MRGLRSPCGFPQGRPWVSYACRLPWCGMALHPRNGPVSQWRRGRGRGVAPSPLRDPLSLQGERVGVRVLRGWGYSGSGADGGGARLRGSCLRRNLVAPVPPVHPHPKPSPLRGTLHNPSTPHRSTLTLALSPCRERGPHPSFQRRLESSVADRPRSFRSTDHPSTPPRVPSLSPSPLVGRGDRAPAIPPWRVMLCPTPPGPPPALRPCSSTHRCSTRAARDSLRVRAIASVVHRR